MIITMHIHYMYMQLDLLLQEILVNSIGYIIHKLDHKKRGI